MLDEEKVEEWVTTRMRDHHGIEGQMKKRRNGGERDGRRERRNKKGKTRAVCGGGGDGVGGRVVVVVVGVTEVLAGGNPKESTIICVHKPLGEGGGVITLIKIVSENTALQTRQSGRECLGCTTKPQQTSKPAL